MDIAFRSTQSSLLHCGPATLKKLSKNAHNAALLVRGIFSESRPKAIPRKTAVTQQEFSGGVRIQRTSIVKHHVQKRTMDTQRAVVFDESQFPKAVHEEAHPGAGCSNHFGQR